MAYKVGDLVRYYDGDLGLITGFDREQDPIVFWFKDKILVFWFKDKIQAACYEQDLTLLSSSE